MDSSGNVKIVDAKTEVADVMREIVDFKKEDDDAFLVMDMTELVHKYNEWTTNLPMIRPFYAVKCNDSPAVIKVLAALGCGFDCASKGEISKVLGLGVSPKDIIYANPAKSPSNLQYAQNVGVTLMTYDNEIELGKIKRYHPHAKVVLRIRADALEANIPLGTKFGCEPQNIPKLIEDTAKLDLNLVGFSFHVGTGCKEPGAYPRAIKLALSFVKIAEKFGYQLNYLDIGGGYPGDAPGEFCEAARLIRNVLEEKKEEIRKFTLIAEPGRYFVCTAYKLATTIVGIKETLSRVIYTVNESIFGLFNCVYSEQIFKIPVQLHKYRQGVLKRSAIWGNTPSHHDRLVDDCLLPELQVGDWIVFEDLGAYSTCLYAKFQGASLPPIYYMVTDEAWELISKGWKDSQKSIKKGK